MLPLFLGETSMNPEAWTALGVGVGAQIIVWVGLMASMRADTGILKRQLADLATKVEKLGDVLIQLARVDGRINMMEERQLLAGKRLDHVIQRVDQLSNRE